MAKFAIVMASVVLLCAAGSVHASSKGFGFIEGVAGSDPDDRTHDGWALILSFSQPVAGDGTLGGTGPILGDIIVTKEVDASSTDLLQYSINGNFIPKVKIEVVVSEATNGRTPYLHWELENARVTSYNVSGSGDGDAVPVEEVAFNFDNIKYEYSEEDEMGHVLGKTTLTWGDPMSPPSIVTVGDVQNFELVTEWVVPEPTSLGLVLLGVVGVYGLRVRRL